MGYNCLDLQGPTIIKGMPPRNVKCFAGICTLQLLLQHHFYSRSESTYFMYQIKEITYNIQLEYPGINKLSEQLSKD